MTRKGERLVDEADQVVRTACPRDCWDSCGILAYLKEGKIVRLKGDPDHPITRGELCLKMTAFPAWVYHPDRLRTPLKRAGQRGENKWTPLTWEEALDITAEKIRRLRDEFGPEAILYLWGTGTHFNLYYRLLPFRFFNALGGATNLRGSLCIIAGHKGIEFTLGKSGGNDPEEIVKTKMLVEWGRNTTSTNIHLMPLIDEALARGAELVVVNPRYTELASRAHLYLQPHPGSDGALALGMMRVILEQEVYDREFVQQYTLGFDRLKERVKEYPLERVEKITGVPAGQIEEFALKYARNKPVCAVLGMGLQHHTNGGNTFRNIAVLAAITGNVGLPGAGVNPTNPQVWEAAMDRSLRLEEMNKHKKTIPIVQFAESLLSQKPHPIKMLFIWAANPVVQNPDTNKTIRALKSKDLDFIVVIDPFMTDTARLADLVLPGCSFLEQTDVSGSYWHYYLQWQQKVIDPLPGTKTDLEIFQELARRLGLEDYFDRTAEEFADLSLIKDSPATKGLSLEGLKKGPFRVKIPEVNFSDLVFPTPSGKIEIYSEQMAELGYDPLPTHVEPEEGPGQTPDLFKKYPLYFLSPHTRYSMHSMDFKNPFIREINPEPFLEIHEEDALTRKISSGDVVKVYNDRGSLEVKAKVTRGIKPGTVAMQQGWGLEYGCANMLTADRLTDFADGSTYFTCLVEVSRADEQK